MPQRRSLTNGTTYFEPLTASHRTIHPALDFFDDKAIISVSLPSVVTPQGKNPETRYANYAITSDHEIFVCSPSELLKRKLFFHGKIFLSPERWSYSSVDAFLDNKLISVDPDNLFTTVKERFDYYLDLIDSRLYSFFTCFVISTYFYPMFPALGIVFLNGLSGTGKTKIITIIDQLAFNSINTANISDPSVYRLIQSSRCTLCLDENEKLSDHRASAQLINLLLAGVGKGAKAVRSEKTAAGDFVPTLFELQSPKVVANIEGLKLEALKNRLIPIVTVKAKDKKKASQEPEKDLDLPIWGSTRDDLHVLALTRFEEIRQAFNSLPDIGLSGQQLRIWQPVLTIAEFIKPFLGNQPFNDIVNLAKQRAAERATETAEDTVDMKVLRGIGKFAKSLNTSQFYPTSHILSYLQSQPDIDISSLSADSLGKIIARLGLGKSERGTVSSKQERGFKLNPYLIKELVARNDLDTS